MTIRLRVELFWRCQPGPQLIGSDSERIAYRDLGVEQLGAVYETLLDYEPRLSSRGVERRSSRSTVVELVRGSGTRKATGSFYTPLPIADYLIRRTLGPLVKDVEPERILQLRVVDPAMGSAGHFSLRLVDTLRMPTRRHCSVAADATPATLGNENGWRFDEWLLSGVYAAST